MNAQVNDSIAQFVAVVFHNFNPADCTIDPASRTAKPYFYFDAYGLKVDDLAVVHNSRELSIVRIVRCIPLDDPFAGQKVTKPILFKADFDEELIKECFSRIKKITAKNQDLEVQADIDRILGYNQDGTPNSRRRRLLGLPDLKTKDFPADDISTTDNNSNNNDAHDYDEPDTD